MTAKQKEFVSLVRANVDSVQTQEGDNGSLLVCAIEDGLQLNCFVSPDGEMDGDWF